MCSRVLHRYMHASVLAGIHACVHAHMRLCMHVMSAFVHACSRMPARVHMCLRACKCVVELERGRPLVFLWARSCLFCSKLSRLCSCLFACVSAGVGAGVVAGFGVGLFVLALLPVSVLSF